MDIENEEGGADLTGSILRLRNMPEPSTLGIRTRPTRSMFSQRSAVRKRSSKLSKYGVSFQPPEDDAVHYASDAKDLSFFERVRIPIIFINLH